MNAKQWYQPQIKLQNHRLSNSSLSDSSAMGLLSWWKGDSKDKSQTTSQAKSAPQSKTEPPVAHPEVPGMNGAVAVNGTGDLPVLTVFEFGSVAAARSPYTMSGYCPVSDDLEPCQWQLDPPSDPNARLFRVVF